MPSVTASARSDRQSRNEPATVAVGRTPTGEGIVNNIIYIVGLIVVVIAVLSFFGLR